MWTIKQIKSNQIKINMEYDIDNLVSPIPRT